MRILPAQLVLLASFLPLNGQEAIPKWEVEIPVLSDVPVSSAAEKPLPIEFSVLDSRTKCVEVNESPEMTGLPPVKGAINVTIQNVMDPGLPTPPPVLPALPPDDPAVTARLDELREAYHGTELVFLSATIYDKRRTLLRIYPNGGPNQAVEAWSNLDFMHFTGQGEYRIRYPDGTVQDIGLLMGVGAVDTSRTRAWVEQHGGRYEAAEIPEIAELANGGPAFVVVKGDADSPAMATLEQLHDLYRKEGARMEAAYHAREQVRAERRAYLTANPPKPGDVTIRFWKREPHLQPSIPSK
ncbi:hypothetical protein [Luteolibacter luteus]|uniref:Uncharacterized protein n=1 Tax=Luteolibacter luteus TaxID=2728835 RepID=A0A858RFQ1_9BACT|nr:hypothetical protein [Luteolibacter luteus]QJE95269.1 hypothetical protein HHL09_05585 [Luteolibacter luteus]